MYTPDRWVIIKITSEKETIYKVMGGWSGSYLEGQSWRINSGIVSVTFDENFYKFSGNSGSTYKCHKKSYGVNSIMASIISQIKDTPDHKIEILDDQDFSNLISH